MPDRGRSQWGAIKDSRRPRPNFALLNADEDIANTSISYRREQISKIHLQIGTGISPF